jgi:hypothetical protein
MRFCSFSGDIDPLLGGWAGRPECPAYFGAGQAFRHEKISTTAGPQGQGEYLRD